LIRMLLVPSFMRLAGRANWWAPAPLRRLHDRFGLTEEVDEDHADAHRTPEIETQENSDADQSQNPIAPRIG
ncbi:hypothetical protein J8J17_27260, partial [Mycobacterium tuberculosis]|nr:hypothetical protein [Mycobacterium tuberculosis]